MNPASLASDAVSQTLTFVLKGEAYAVSIESIKEIIEYPDLTSVPLMPPFLRGVMNLRGAVIPVIDLAARFNLGKSEQGRRSCVVIFEVTAEDGQLHTLGIAVDVVNEVIDISPSQIDSTPEFGTSIPSEFIRGMLRLNGRIVVLIALERVLSIEHLESQMLTY
jgi:purine-binding chemotaxis protein CheW